MTQPLSNGPYRKYIRLTDEDIRLYVINPSYQIRVWLLREACWRLQELAAGKRTTFPSDLAGWLADQIWEWKPRVSIANWITGVWSDAISDDDVSRCLPNPTGEESHKLLLELAFRLEFGRGMRSDFLGWAAFELESLPIGNLDERRCRLEANSMRIALMYRAVMKMRQGTRLKGVPKSDELVGDALGAKETKVKGAYRKHRSTIRALIAYGVELPKITCSLDQLGENSFLHLVRDACSVEQAILFMDYAQYLEWQQSGRRHVALEKLA